ncbi:hypothetical protein LBMAG27_08630 [Bacteroidota bacterium]|nr:hypothetical protein LBMAG27_08630 [Bacteroidota bacterium]
MCYNYSYIQKRGLKAAHHSGEISEEEYREQVLQLNGLKISDSSNAENNLEEQLVFPGMESPVITIEKLTVEDFQFGFLPEWSKDYKDFRKNFNARSETILEKPTWRKAFQKNQRCLIISSAFFEENKKTKQRYRFSLNKEEPVLYAGTYNNWIDKTDGVVIPTFAIITCEANETVAPYHNRMPVILKKEGQEKWLDKKLNHEMIYDLLQPISSDEMIAIETNPIERKKKKETKKDSQLGFEF